ncbi:Vegetative incompatibility protein HET-E-1 [Fusarium oxysporum f. sp. raphani]|uniref:Vegetative incompatibility protein HET-E-1 n=1 Tax=Fusarium oxysporum f. sp. raphani TaxID=96318 RepID=A0A8J5UHH7_FUSOX|nr:Vegetative incompatibility protein HET-E-1 [Fusarium oxysporum f. sp. raphani]
MDITRRFSRSCSKAEIASVGISPSTSAVFAIYTAAQTSQSWIDVFDIKTQSGYSKTSGSRAVFSPNGSKLATIRDWTVQFTGGFDFHHSSTVFLRDYVSGKTACELKEAKGEPIAWSRDGRLIAVGEARNRIGVWDVKNGVRVGKVLSHIDAVTHAAFLPDQSLVTISRDGTLRITNTKTCKTIRRLEIDGSNNPRALAVSPDGRRIVSVWGTNVHIWIPSANDLTSYNLNAVRAVEGWPLAISPDCRYMLCRTEDGFDIMDVATGTIMYDEATEEMVMSGAFDEDAKVLVLGRMDGVVEVRDVFDRRKAQALNHKQQKTWVRNSAYNTKTHTQNCIYTGVSYVVEVQSAKNRSYSLSQATVSATLQGNLSTIRSGGISRQGHRRSRQRLR